MSTSAARFDDAGVANVIGKILGTGYYKLLGSITFSKSATIDAPVMLSTRAMTKPE